MYDSAKPISPEASVRAAICQSFTRSAARRGPWPRRCRLPSGACSSSVPWVRPDSRRSARRAAAGGWAWGAGAGQALKPVVALEAVEFIG